MEFWEFLIQKEGDRSWLPLESPDVEILEGRYRVVARSHRANAPTEIRITHLAETEHPPKRRVRKRSSKTNPDGLLVVMPFTRLEGGTWELRCTSDLMTDMMGNSWSYSVALQVVAQDAEVTDLWEPEWNAPSVEDSPAGTATEPVDAVEALAAIALSPAAGVTPPPEPAISAGVLASPPLEPVATSLPNEPPEVLPPGGGDVVHPDEPVDSESEVGGIDPILLLEQASAASDQVVDELFAALEEDDPIAPTPTAQTGEPQPKPLPNLELTLERESYVARRDHPLLLNGAIARLKHSPEDQPPALEGTLRVRLYDPQSALALVDIQQCLTLHTFPHSFSCAVPVPRALQTRLMLGEMVFLVETNGRSDAIATQSFSVTVGLEDLLEALADSLPSESDAVHPPLDFAPEVPTPLNLAFLDLLRSPGTTPTFQTVNSPVLPPQIYASADRGDRPRTVELPLLQPPHQASSASESAIAPVSPEEPSIPELVRTDAPEPSRVTTPVEPGSDPPSADPTPADPTPADPTPDNPTPAVASAQDPAGVEPETRVVGMPPDMAPPVDDTPLEFHELVLNPLPFQAVVAPEPEEPLSPADQSFRSLNLKRRFWERLNALVSDRELSSLLPLDDPLQPSAAHATFYGSDRDLVAQEVVADEALPPQGSGLRAAAPVQPAASAWVLEEDEPIPTPQVSVPGGELTAGKPIFISIKLPNLATHIYVKVWVHDLHTRSLLDGPRWLIDFAPDGFGNLETTTQLTVPFGCTEIQFEAIAVEMATHRESRKVVLQRRVVPPNLPSMSMEELDVFF